MKRLALLTLVLCFSLVFSLPAFARTFVTIGTGGVTGVYYPTGGAISKMVNSKSDVYDIKATVESTGGSVYNINAVLSGNLEFGICQSDRQFQAINGLAEWKNRGPQKDLRSVFSIHPESVTLVAAEKSGIKSPEDLKGKKVNLGNPGSGQLQNSKDVLSAFGMTPDDVEAAYVKAVEAPGLLQDERLDAFFYTVGHPAGNISEATSGRIKVRIVPVTGAPIEKLIKDKPYYAIGKIDMKHYPQAANADAGMVESVGVKATLVTRASLDDDIVYAITKEVFENFDSFKSLHPAYSVLTKKDMLQGLSAPLHPGAVKYYKEAGLLKYADPSLY
jgi:hypothetical protein